MAYSFTYTNSCGERTTVFCRNVSTKNPDESLQFEIEQERGMTKRSYTYGFSLPTSEIPKFLEAIQKED